MDEGIMWQVAEGSSVLHAIDPDRPAPRRSGPRALCGRYPQRYERPWFSATPAEVARCQGVYGLRRCEKCDYAVAALVIEEADRG